MEFTSHLYVKGHEEEFQFSFFKADKQGEEALCLVKSRILEYPVIFGKNVDGSWSCISNAPVIIAEVAPDISRSIIDYKVLKDQL